MRRMASQNYSPITLLQYGDSTVAVICLSGSVWAGILWLPDQGRYGIVYTKNAKQGFSHARPEPR